MSDYYQSADEMREPSLWLRIRYPVWIIEDPSASRPIYRVMVFGKAVRMPRWIFRYVL